MTKAMLLHISPIFSLQTNQFFEKKFCFETFSKSHILLYFFLFFNDLIYKNSTPRLIKWLTAIIKLY